MNASKTSAMARIVISKLSFINLLYQNVIRLLKQNSFMEKNYLLIIFVMQMLLCGS